MAEPTYLFVPEVGEFTSFESNLNFDMMDNMGNMMPSFGSVHPSQSPSSCISFHPSGLIDQLRQEHPELAVREIKRMAKKQWLEGLLEFSDSDEGATHDAAIHQRVIHAPVPQDDRVAKAEGQEPWKKKLAEYSEKGFP